jgi:hypothetical protein
MGGGGLELLTLPLALLPLYREARSNYAEMQERDEAARKAFHDKMDAYNSGNTHCGQTIVVMSDSEFRKRFG